jgi:ElaB/YqjD/DUF883 family membrane-anchored ribosome-binding protein
MASNSMSNSFGRSTDQLRDVANSGVDAARRAGEEVGAATRAEFNSILADLQDLAARAGRASGRELAALRDQMADKLSTAREKVGVMSGDAAVVARRGIDATGEAIQGRPFQSVALAALAGFAIGFLVSRR